MHTEKKEFEYQEEGIVSDTIGTVIALFVGLGVLILVIILIGILSGKAYNIVSPSLINLDNDGNALKVLAIEQDINSSMVDAFAAYGDAVAFIGIIVLALVFFLVLALLGTGMRPFTGNGSGAI